MSHGFAFCHHELWPDDRLLLGAGVPVPLGGRAFDLLHLLVLHRHRVVPMDELMAQVWPGLAVETNNLQVQVWSLRRLLGRHAIVTVPRRGYRFVAPVQRLDRMGAPTEGLAPAGTEAGSGSGSEGGGAWQRWSAALRAPWLVVLTGDDAQLLHRCAQRLAQERGSAALWQLQAVALPQAVDGSRLWLQLGRARGQVLLLDCHRAPQLVRRWLLAGRQAAPALQVLATSAHALGLPAETVVQVPPWLVAGQGLTPATVAGLRRHPRLAGPAA